MDDGRITVAMVRTTFRDRNHTTFEQMARKLDPDRFRLISICLKSGENCDFRFQHNNQTMYCLSNKDKLKGLSPAIVLRMIRVLRTERVDILHCHRHKPSFYGALAGFIARTPAVFLHVHGLGRTRNFRRKVTNLLLFKLANKVIGCAESVRTDTVKSNPYVNPDKIIAMRNSVDYKRYSETGLSKAQARITTLPTIDNDAIVFGMVARFGPRKGHDNLIKAFRKAKSRIPSAQLVLVGDGPARKNIEQMADDENITDSVHFLGHRKDIPLLLRAIDFFVLPSVGSEGMPLVLLEAMSAGVPCIATNLSGIPEIITDDSLGLLVPPDNICALTEAMTDFAQMPRHKIDAIVQASKERIRTHFDHSLLAAELSQFYEQQLHNSNAPYPCPIHP